MRRAIAALASLLGACAGVSGQPVAAPAPSTSAAPPPPMPVTVDAALGRTADEGSVLLRLSVVRTHPLGPRVEPFVLAWPGWSSTIASLSSHPVADLEWIDVVGPKDPALERLATRTPLGDEVVDGKLAARNDGTLRVALRPQPHVVVAIPPSAASTAEILRSAPLVEPRTDDDEALHVDFPHPHEMVPEIPVEARHLVLRVFSRPGGAAEAFGELTCDDAATASHVADDLRGRVDGVNNLIVRVLTRGLLSGLSIRLEGAAVELRLPATREQLESLATLAAGFLPAPPR
jgi:hypothetical protein